MYFLKLDEEYVCIDEIRDIKVDKSVTKAGRKTVAITFKDGATKEYFEKRQKDIYSILNSLSANNPDCVISECVDEPQENTDNVEGGPEL